MGRGEGRDGEWDGVGKGGREGKEGMGGGREGTPPGSCLHSPPLYEILYKTLNVIRTISIFPMYSR